MNGWVLPGAGVVSGLGRVEMRGKDGASESEEQEGRVRQNDSRLENFGGKTTPCNRGWDKGCSVVRDVNTFTVLIRSSEK